MFILPINPHHAKLLSHTIDTAKRMGLLPEKLLKNVNVDTTVQEKAITFPTDTKLRHRMRIQLISAAKKRSITLVKLTLELGKKPASCKPAMRMLSK